MKPIKISTPLNDVIVKRLKAGDIVYLTGEIFTARDAAHKRLVNMINKDEKLPFDIKNQIIYYVGPCPAKPGEVIGSAGPTTSSRMDIYTPYLLEIGLKGMIGKGMIGNEVIESIVKNKGVYFGAVAGAGALIAKSIVKQEIIAFEDLMSEAIRKLFVEEFPLTVLVDSYGNDIYKIGKEKYRIK